MPKYNPRSDPTKHPDWPQNRGQQSYAWTQWNRARQNIGLPRVDPPRRLGINVTQRPAQRRGQPRPSNASISYVQFTNERRGLSGPLIDGFNRQRAQQEHRNDHLLNTVVASDLSESEQMEVEGIINQVQGGSISSADFDDRNGAGPSSDMSAGGKRAHPGPQGQNSGGVTPTSATATTAGTGHNSQSDGGFDSAQGPVTQLPRGGYKSNHGTMTFTKVHRMKTWAIPYWKLADTSRAGSNLVTTPLAKIPWEYAFFYLSPEEFTLIPAGSYIDSVKIDVMQTVATTGYPTGGTESSIATTNHPKVLLIGKDLDRKCRGGIDKSVAINTKMIPTTLAPTAARYTDFIAKQYGTDQNEPDASVVVPGVAHKIPYYNNIHFCIYQPNKAQATARGFTAENSPGFEYFQNYITEMNSNDTTWDFVDSMSYKFVNAPIGQQYRQLEILTDDFSQHTGGSGYYHSNRNVTDLNPNENIKITESITPSDAGTIPVVTYKSAAMEQGAHYVRGDAPGKPARQPTFHIGMRAIDKQSPDSTSSRASDFVQALIEFEITATMTVNLPSYPNRFVRPKFYNTSIENAAQGTGFYPIYSDERFVTFNLTNSGATAPDRSAVDQVNDENTEDNLVIPRRNLRPRRAVPQVFATIKKK